LTGFSLRSEGYPRGMRRSEWQALDVFTYSGYNKEVDGPFEAHIMKLKKDLKAIKFINKLGY